MIYASFSKGNIPKKKETCTIFDQSKKYDVINML